MGVKKYPKDKFVPARRMNDKTVGLYDRVTKRFFANAGTGAFLAPGDQPPRGRRWSLARAREWGRTNPWYCGFNHVPANAINDIPNILPIHKEAGVGSMLWGLVNGKAQTHLPNGGFTANYKGPWKHDLFHSDHRPYSVKDLELIRAATRATTK